MNEKPHLITGCLDCSLNGEVYLQTKPTGKKDIIFIGDAPGKYDPFGIGQDIFEAAIMELDTSFTTTNLVRCRPPRDRDPSRDEIQCCWENLQYFIEDVDPKLVVLFGEKVLYKALNLKGIKKLNGKIFGNTPIPTAVCVHPSYVSHTGDLMAFEKGMLPVINFFKEAREVKYKCLDKFPHMDEAATDIEASGLRPHEGVIKSIASSDGKNTYFSDSMPLELMKTHLEKTPLTCHHAQFEHLWFLSHGINANIVDDTRLLGYFQDILHYQQQ